jgi:hypothetical protein
MQLPTWIEFTERPVPDFEPGSPASELASVLRRHHADLEAAARAAADARVQGLRALAEQAVLATELEAHLERQGVSDDDGPLGALHAALSEVKDRMLSQIAGSGLEIVRLHGRPAAAVGELADIESWRYDDRFDAEHVVEELEVAVLHLGRPLRRGRVIMGAPSRGGPATVEVTRSLTRHDDAHLPAAPRSGVAEAAAIECPVADCRAHNELDAEVCVVCLTPLAGYRRLSLFPQVLFNRGLRAARAGNRLAARDCFAAAVVWHPEDIETRNAYALACLESRDRDGARGAWERVLELSPRDPLALRGLRALGGARLRRSVLAHDQVERIEPSDDLAK